MATTPAQRGERLFIDGRWEEPDEMDCLAALPTAELAEEVLAVAHAADAAASDEGDHDIVSDGSGTFEGERWLARPLAIAETAAVNALPEAVDPEIRLAAAGALRMFLRECPDCGSDLVESTTAACCGGHTNPLEVPDDVLRCPACDARLYTFD